MLDMDMEMDTDMDDDDVSPSLPLLQPWAQTCLGGGWRYSDLDGLSWTAFLTRRWACVKNS
jgi:hypothetical protein